MAGLIGYPYYECGTVATSHAELVCEVGQLHMQLAALEKRIAPMVWLERQQAIFTPELTWINDGKVDLASAVKDAKARAEFKVFKEREQGNPKHNA